MSDVTRTVGSDVRPSASTASTQTGVRAAVAAVAPSGEESATTSSLTPVAILTQTTATVATVLPTQTTATPLVVVAPSAPSTSSITAADTMPTAIGAATLESVPETANSEEQPADVADVASVPEEAPAVISLVNAEAQQDDVPSGDTEMESVEEIDVDNLSADREMPTSSLKRPPMSPANDNGKCTVEILF